MERLFAHIEDYGDSPALIGPDGREVSYASFARLADEAAREMAGKSQLLAIEAANAVAPLAMYVGALRAGHVVLLTAPGSLASSPVLHASGARFVYRCEAGGWLLEDRGGDSPALHPDLALLLSTSGSTGSPKLIRLSHANLASNALAIAEYLEFAPGERAITSLPPYYSYGMSVINSHLMTGHTLVLSEESAVDTGFWEKVARHGVTSFAGVPHSFDLLEHSGFLAAEHPSLRYYTQAGGRLPPEKVRLFAKHAEARGQRFYVMYGQTEAGPRMAYVPPQDAARFPDCIGRPIPGGAFRLDGAAEGEESGELVYAGPNVMMGYALAPADLARPAELAELRTGDVATRNEAGYYRIVGRMSRFSKLFGLRIGLDDVEARLAAAGFKAVVAGDDKGLVVATTDAGRAPDIATLLGDALKLPPAVIEVREVAEIPRLPSGKVDYVSLLKRRDAAPVAAGEPGRLRSRIAHILGVDQVGGKDAFITLGGDSLNYVQVSLLLEEQLGHVPNGWETMPFAELEKLGRARRGIAKVEPTILIRAVAILLVLFHHVSEIDMAGAAFSLLAVAGFNFARFQVPKLAAGEIWPCIRSMLLKVALPYYALLTLFFLYLRQIWWPLYLLFNNFTTGFRQNGVVRMQIYWFIEAYIGLYLIFCALFLIPAVRRLARERPWALVLPLIAVTTTLRITGELIEKTPAFYKNTPLMLGYVFAIGWAIFIARTMWQRAALAAFAIPLFYVLPPAHVEIGRAIFFAALLLLIFVPRIPVGGLAVRLLSLIAAASLYIYISHPLLLQPARKLFDGPVPQAWWLPMVLLCVLAGIALWKVVSLVDENGRQWLSALPFRRPVTSG
jgi:hypothetical protein